MGQITIMVELVCDLDPEDAEKIENGEIDVMGLDLNSYADDWREQTITEAYVC